MTVYYGKLLLDQMKQLDKSSTTDNKTLLQSVSYFTLAWANSVFLIDWQSIAVINK